MKTEDESFHFSNTCDKQTKSLDIHYVEALVLFAGLLSKQGKKNKYFVFVFVFFLAWLAHEQAITTLAIM